MALSSTEELIGAQYSTARVEVLKAVHIILHSIKNPLSISYKRSKINETSFNYHSLFDKLNVSVEYNVCDI